MSEDGRSLEGNAVEHGSTVGASEQPGPAGDTSSDDASAPGEDAGGPRKASRPAARKPRRRRRRKNRRNRKGRGRRRMPPAFVSGTSSEFLGRRPLPRAARTRHVVFLMGPPGVGKSEVARRLLDDPDALHLSGDELQDALTNQARRRTWRDDIRHAPTLILDGPCYLHRRPAVVRMLVNLLRERAEDDLRTMVCEGPDRRLAPLMDGVPADDRATIALRFPVGRGRRRYAARVCDELGIDRRHASACAELEPWTYDTVQAALEDIRDELRKERRRRRRRAVRLCDKLDVPRQYADRLMDLDPWDKDAAVEILERVQADLARKRRRAAKGRKKR